jgi:hypothetical protein
MPACTSGTDMREDNTERQFLLIYKNPVRTSQETHYFSVTKIKRLMLFREITVVCHVNCKEHMLKTDDTYRITRL